MIRNIAETIKIPTENIPEVDLNQANLQNILSVVFMVIGGLAVLFLLIGAFKYVTSNGDQGQITQAKNTILYAVIGIIISMSAFTIVQVIAGVVSN